MLKVALLVSLGVDTLPTLRVEKMGSSKRRQLCTNPSNHHPSSLESLLKIQGAVM
jgi:hypothetical protein